jgi:hypothetical protein
MGGPPDNAVFEYDWSLLEPETNGFLPHAGFFYLPTEENLVNEATTRLQKAGFKNPSEAAKHFKLPDRKALVFPHQLLFEHPTTIPRVATPLSDEEWLRNALILGACNQSTYDPDGPVIWTEKRLKRMVHLHLPSPFYAD